MKYYNLSRLFVYRTTTPPQKKRTSNILLKRCDMTFLFFGHGPWHQRHHWWMPLSQNLHQPWRMYLHFFQSQHVTNPCIYIYIYYNTYAILIRLFTFIYIGSIISYGISSNAASHSFQLSTSTEFPTWSSSKYGTQGLRFCCWIINMYHHFPDGSCHFRYHLVSDRSEKATHQFSAKTVFWG